MTQKSETSYVWAQREKLLHKKQLGLSISMIEQITNIVKSLYYARNEGSSSMNSYKITCLKVSLGHSTDRRSQCEKLVTVNSCLTITSLTSKKSPDPNLS